MTCRKSTKRKYPRGFNESRGPYRIIHATKWSKGGRGEQRTRLIVITWPGNKIGHGNYAIRWETADGATYGGYSFDTQRSAHDAFLHKYLEHNESFRPGNISHLPGIAK